MAAQPTNEPEAVSRPHAGATGYGHAAYASAIADGGTSRVLPGAGAAVIVRAIGTSAHRDATGPYPLLCCADWSRLGADLAELADDLVAVSAVLDPFGDWTVDGLRACFPDLLLRFKDHAVVELAEDPLARVHPHHRRNVTKGRREVEVEVVTDLEPFTAEWLALYRQLADRHRISGEAAFSDRSLTAQLHVPGLVALRARAAGTTVGASLWYVQGDIAYYHLAAYAPRGYELRASFVMFAHALELFAAQGLRWVSLGAGAGATDDPDDGLARFKRGWATGTRTAWFGGRVLQPDVYDRLAGPSPRRWFPAYREGETR